MQKDGDLMASRKTGNDPLSDMSKHGKHPFPPEIEEILNALLQVLSRKEVRRHITDQEFLDWEAGENLERGRIKLQRLLDENSD